MPKPRTLRLHEEVLLLALRNDKGTVAGGVMYQQAVGGAILAELILEGRVNVVTEGRSTYAEVADVKPLGDPILDECLQKIESASRKKLASWVGKFAGLKQLKHRVAAGLRDKGILKEEEDRVLLLFTRRLYPELDPSYEKAVVTRLSEAIFDAQSTVDPRTTVLVALAHHSGLLKANFDKRRLKEHRQRLEAVVKGDAVGKATKQAIEAVQAAVMAAVIIPAVVSAGH